MMKPRFLLITAVSAVLTSCYQDINMDDYRPSPTMVLNCVASSDTVITAQISQTIFFTDLRKTNNYVDNAQVRVIINDSIEEYISYQDSTKSYVSTHRPNMGDKVRVEAKTESNEIVTGECTVPQAITINNVALRGRLFEDRDQITSSGEYGKAYEVTYSISFDDDASVRNFYAIRIEDPTTNLASETLDYSHDPIFMAQQSGIDGTSNSIDGPEGRTFTDDLFNGQQCTLTIVEKSPLYTSIQDGDTRKKRIIIYALSEEYYKYLTGILNNTEDSTQSDLTEWGMAEPLSHYSNIEGGTGIVGGVSSTSIVVDIFSVLKDKQ